MAEAGDKTNGGKGGEDLPPVAATTASESRDDFEQVKLLFDYTKFHIGLYTTAAASLIAFTNTDVGKSIRLPEPLVWLTVAFIAVAGLAGGIVASTLPHCRTLREFWSRRIGPFRLRVFPGEVWTYIEHSAFWLAIVTLFVAFRCRPQ